MGIGQKRSQQWFAQANEFAEKGDRIAAGFEHTVAVGAGLKGAAVRFNGEEI